MPDYNSFPLLFFLTTHPETDANIHLKNRQVRKNCVIWEVYERFYDCKKPLRSEKNSPELFLGLSIMPCNSKGVPGLPIGYGDQAAISLFGDHEMLGVGMFNVNKYDDNFDNYDEPIGDPSYMKYFFNSKMESKKE